MSNVTADQSSVLDHARAKYAVEVVDRLLQANDEEGLKKYRTVVLNAGTSIRQIGLAQFTAFGLSKGGEHVDVLKDLYDWLRQSSATNWITRERKKKSGLRYAAAPELMKSLLQRSAGELAALEAETQQYLTWLKRLTEGAWKDLERLKRERPNGAST